MTLRAIDLVHRWAEGEIVDVPIRLRQSNGPPVMLRAAECRIAPYMKIRTDRVVLFIAASDDGRLFMADDSRAGFGDYYLFDLARTYADSVERCFARGGRYVYWPDSVCQLLKPRDELILLDDNKRPREYKISNKSCVWYCKSRLVGMRYYDWMAMPWFDAKGDYMPNPLTGVIAGLPPYVQAGL